MRHIVIHYHIFKNAGSTIDEFLRNNFRDSCSSLEGNTPWDTMSSDRILRHVAENPTIKAISSHQARLPEPMHPDTVFYPLIFLRHPIDRVGSVYAFERRQARTPLRLGVKIAQEQDLAGYVRWRLSYGNGAVIRNFQTVHLAGRERDMRLANATLVDFHIALEQLSRLHYFGIVELFSISVVHMAKYLSPGFGSLNTFFEVKNKSQGRRTSMKERLADIEAALGPQLHTELLEKNALDLELYNKAVNLFHDRNPAVSSPQNALSPDKAAPVPTKTDYERGIMRGR